MSLLMTRSGVQIPLGVPLGKSLMTHAILAALITFFGVQTVGMILLELNQLQELKYSATELKWTMDGQGDRSIRDASL